MRADDLELQLNKLNNQRRRQQQQQQQASGGGGGGGTAEAAGGRARLLYVIPTGHNPTGAVMSEQRKRQLLKVGGVGGRACVCMCVVGVRSCGERVCLWSCVERWLGRLRRNWVLA